MLQQYNSYDLCFREKKKTKRKRKEKRKEQARKNWKVLSFMYD